MGEDRALRVIQWARGSIGQISIRHMAGNPAYELVGCYATSEEKEGRDAGELADIGPLGVTATRDADGLLALDADCVNYAPLYVDVEEVCRILRSGKNVVTPSGFTFPPALDVAVRDRLEAACLDGGVSLFGTGIHPGFAGDLLPVTFARLASRPTEPDPNGDIGYWGRIWTAMAAVNAIPTVVDAPAGLRTHLDLPVIQPPHLLDASAVRP